MEEDQSPAKEEGEGIRGDEPGAGNQEREGSQKKKDREEKDEGGASVMEFTGAGEISLNGGADTAGEAAGGTGEPLGGVNAGRADAFAKGANDKEKGDRQNGRHAG